MEALNYQETIIVGKALKSCDPDMIKRMRYDGYRTGAKAVVEYVLNSDPDSIMSIVEYLVEEGDLPEGTEREVFDELYENTAECEQCGRSGLTYPAWQGVPEHPICASCALSTTTTEA